MNDIRLSRRGFTRVGAGLSIGLSLGGLPSLVLAQPASDPITKPIPSTGERLPVIGLGTNQYSVDTAEAMAPLQEVLESMAAAGGRVIDTARGYGRSEIVIGELLDRTGLRDQFFISTKTPMGGDLSDPDAVLQTSFDQLQVDTIDLMLIHNLYGLDELMPAFLKAKEAGRIRYVGMSTSTDNQYEAQMAGMRKYPLDFIQVDYSLGNRSAAESILPLAQERDMAVLANTPFGGRRNASSTFATVADVALPDWAAEIDATSWAQVFLKYVVSHPTITVAIPGTIRPSHVVDNQGAGRGRLPDAALRAEIEKFWDALDA
jgi:diketogulonate reductase-like aldo/keto reductase